MEKITITTIIKDLLEWFQDGEKYKHDDLGGFVEDIYGSSILNLGLTIEAVSYTHLTLPTKRIV